MQESLFGLRPEMFLAVAGIGIAVLFWLKQVTHNHVHSQIYKGALTLLLAVSLWLTTSYEITLAPFFATLAGVVLSALWAPSLGRLLIHPITNALDGGSESPDRKPVYSIARNLRNTGQFTKAVEEVQRQLKRFPHDNEGMMLLAEIHAMNLRDVSSAHDIVERILKSRKSTEEEQTEALFHLSHWYRAEGNDDCAKLALQRICMMFPGSDYALRAQRKLIRIDEKAEERASEERRTGTANCTSHLV